jgi:hypothetical protein
MARKPAKSRQTRPKSRGPYTPEPVRGRVIARHINGQSNRQIASEEGIDRETVGRILSQPEITQLMEQYRSRLLMMVPQAMIAFGQLLDSDDERIKAAAVMKLLEGLQVFPRGTVEPLPPDPNQKRLIMLGQMMEMMIYKKEKYSLPLPPELAALEDKARKRIEAPLQ